MIIELDDDDANVRFPPDGPPHLFLPVFARDLADTPMPNNQFNAVLTVALFRPVNSDLLKLLRARVLSQIHDDDPFSGIPK
jgi:hypothetical protein